MNFDLLLDCLDNLPLLRRRIDKRTSSVFRKRYLSIVSMYRCHVIIALGKLILTRTCTYLSKSQQSNEEIALFALIFRRIINTTIIFDISINYKNDRYLFSNGLSSKIRMAR